MCYHLLNKCSDTSCEKVEFLDNPLYWCKKATRLGQQCPGGDFICRPVPQKDRIRCRKHSTSSVFTVDWDPSLESVLEGGSEQNSADLQDNAATVDIYQNAKQSDPTSEAREVAPIGTSKTDTYYWTSSENLPRAKHGLSYSDRVPPLRLNKMSHIKMSQEDRVLFERLGITHTKRPMHDEYEDKGWIEPEEFGHWRTRRSLPSITWEPGTGQSHAARLKRALQWAPDWPAPLPYEPVREFLVRQKSIYGEDSIDYRSLFEWWAQNDENLHSDTYRWSHTKIDDTWVQSRAKGKHSAGNSGSNLRGSSQ